MRVCDRCRSVCDHRDASNCACGGRLTPWLPGIPARGGARPGLEAPRRASARTVGVEEAAAEAAVDEEPYESLELATGT